jgi:hypothetical protein
MRLAVYGAITVAVAGLAVHDQYEGMSRSLLNIEKRSLPRLMLGGVGLVNKDAA